MSHELEFTKGGKETGLDALTRSNATMKCPVKGKIERWKKLRKSQNGYSGVIKKQIGGDTEFPRNIGLYT